MPFNSRAYRILIASPSDVDEEREIAVRVIQEWNDLYSYSRGVVLLPLRWETHSAPEYGTRPQEVINRAVVDQCDLLVGMFWTRIGSPTGVADSGTIEEIGRVAKAGKPVMLYFSKVGADPGQLDLKQLAKLNEFKTQTYPNALTESYRSPIEFRDKFAKQLELKVRDLQIADAQGGPPPLNLAVATRDLKSVEKGRAIRTVEAIDVVDMEAGLEAMPEVAKQLQEHIEAYVVRAASAPVVLAIENLGTSGIRNLYVEMDVTTSKSLVITDEEPVRPDRYNSLFARWAIDLGATMTLGNGLEWSGPDTGWENADLKEGLKITPTGWRLTFEWTALQPQRVRFVSPVLYLKAQSNGTVKFLAKVFADSLPEPLSLETQVDIEVFRRKVQVRDLVRNAEKPEIKPTSTHRLKVPKA